MSRFRMEVPAAIYFTVEAKDADEAKELADRIVSNHSGTGFKLGDMGEGATETVCFPENNFDTIIEIVDVEEIATDETRSDGPHQARFARAGDEFYPLPAAHIGLSGVVETTLDAATDAAHIRDLSPMTVEDEGQNDTPHEMGWVGSDGRP